MINDYQKSILTLIAKEGKTTQEVARELNTKPSVVNSNLVHMKNYYEAKSITHLIYKLAKKEII